MKTLRLDGLGIFLLGIAALIAVVAGVFLALSPYNLQAACFAEVCLKSDDLKAQNSMATAAWAMVYVSLGSMLIGAVSVALIYRTLKDTNATANASIAAAEIAEKALNYEKQKAQRLQLQENLARMTNARETAERRRPYVYLTATYAEVSGHWFSIELFLHNSGEKAAIGYVDIEVICTSATGDSVELPPKTKTTGVVTGGRDSVRTVKFPLDVIRNKFGSEQFRVHAKAQLVYRALSDRDVENPSVFEGDFTFDSELANDKWQLDELIDESFGASR